jgi:uncharacterized protein involved in exopolysaccharide biosynthesis
VDQPADATAQPAADWRQALFVPSFKDYLRLLAAQRAFLVVFSLSAVVTAVALTYVASERYEARAALFYRPQEVTRFSGKEARAFGSPVPQAPFKVISQTVQEVMLSDSILRPIVSELDLAAVEPRPPAVWYVELYRKIKAWLLDQLADGWSLLKYGRLFPADRVQNAVDALRANIILRNRDSYVFDVIVRDTRPDRPARIAQALANGVSEWLVGQETLPGRERARQLSTLIAAKERDITQLHEQVTELLKSQGTASLPLETERTTSGTHDLKLAEKRLAAEIADQQAVVATLGQRLAQALDSQGVPRGRGGFFDPDDAKKMASDRLFTEIQLRGMIARQEVLKAEIDGMERQVAKFPRAQARLSELETALEASKRDLVELRADLQEAELLSSAPVSELHILSPAVDPVRPLSPIKIYHAGLALVVSLVLGIGMVITLTMLDLRALFPSRGPKGRARPPATPGTQPMLPPTSCQRRA